MQLVLRQEFPLGRFHATRWRINPFDDPYGEWPPSPWRLVRAVVARWYQWVREEATEPTQQLLEKLVHALCTSTYSFHLSPYARKGNPVRQYQPAEFEIDPPNFKAYSAVFKVPAASNNLPQRLHDEGALSFEIHGIRAVVNVNKSKAKKRIEKLLGKPVDDWHGLLPDAGFRSYTRTLVQDNYWCVPGAGAAGVWWFIDGDDWHQTVIEVLDQCLERITYFGRAEAFTRIRRVSTMAPAPNCSLSDARVAGSVPVLVPNKNATTTDIERITDHPDAIARSVPPGASTMYAIRPTAPPLRELRTTHAVRSDRNLMQFAIGWNVAPEVRSIVRLTGHFRGAVIRELLRIRTGNRQQTWSRAGAAVRHAITNMIGKDAHGQPLPSHNHTEFLAWCEDGVPTRLLVWRDGRPFDEDEQTAVHRAASRPVSWTAAGPDIGQWNVNLIPLDRAVLPPPGFDGIPSRVWDSITPYVPPRHHLRGGRPRPRESVDTQIRRELSLRGFQRAEHVEVERIGDATWVAVHVPRGEAVERTVVGDRRGYQIRLIFYEPVKGPIRLGHSASFGLGLFAPVGE